jgi:hypothetical protein
MASHAIPHLMGLFYFVMADQLHVAYTERSGQLVERHDGRVPAAPFQTADVLLTEAGTLRELLLGQAFPLPDSLDILAHQPAHIHAQCLPDYTL